MLDFRDYSCQENCKSKSSKGKGKIIFESSPPLLLVVLARWSRLLKHHSLKAELTAVNWLTFLGARSPRSECQQDPVLMEALPLCFLMAVLLLYVHSAALIPSQGPHIPDSLDPIIF